MANPTRPPDPPKTITLAVTFHATQMTFAVTGEPGEALWQLQEMVKWWWVMVTSGALVKKGDA